MKTLGIKIAVITNSSLIGREDVREELMNADWVFLKVDFVREKVCVGSTAPTAPYAYHLFRMVWSNDPTKILR